MLVREGWAAGEDPTNFWANVGLTVTSVIVRMMWGDQIRYQEDNACYNVANVILEVKVEHSKKYNIVMSTVRDYFLGDVYRGERGKTVRRGKKLHFPITYGSDCKIKLYR